MVDKATDIPFTIKHGKNCVHIAAHAGYLNLFKKLADDNNVHVHWIKADRLTPLHYCVLNNNYELIKLLVRQGTDILCKTTHGKNSLHIAALAGNSRFAKHLSMITTLRFI